MSYYKYPGRNDKRHCIFTNVKLQCHITNIEAWIPTDTVFLQMSSYKCQVTMSYYKYQDLNIKRHCIPKNGKLQMLCYSYNLKCFVTNVKLQCKAANLKPQMLSNKSQIIMSI